MADSLSKFAARLAAVERQLAATSRTAKLAYSSVEGGAIDIHDGDGGIRGSIGTLPDGTTGVIIVNGPPPPTPTAPVVEPGVSGFRITWDGRFTGGAVAPLDLSRVQVHLLASAETPPDVRKPAATIEAGSGASVTIASTAYDGLWVRLVAVSTSGTPGLASAAVPAAARRAGAGDLGNGAVQPGHISPGAVGAPHLEVGAVGPEHISVGQGTNLVPDPGFEGAATANVLAAAGSAWSLAPGNRTGVGVRADCTAEDPAAPVYLTLPLATVPVIAASQLHLGIDVLASDDLVAQGVKIMARWEDSAGQVLGYGVAELSSPTPGVWQRASGQVAAPQGTTRAVLALEASAAVSGSVVFDNAEAITVFGRATGGARAELGPAGLRLYDETGDTAVALVTGEPQYLTLRSGGQAVATIDTSGTAGFADLHVAGSLSVGGDSVSALLAQHARGLVALDYQATPVRTSGGEYGYVEVTLDVDVTRMYRIVFDAQAKASVAGGDVHLRLRDGGAASPTVASPQLQFSPHPLPTTAPRRVRLEHIVAGSALGAGLHRLLITFQNVGGPVGQSVDLLGATGSLGLLYVEDVGARIPETGAYNTGAGSTVPPPRAYTRTYAATWSGSYANRGAINAYHKNACVQGYTSRNDGVQAALIGFPAQLATDLAGAQITKAEVYLYFDHWAAATGGKAVIRAHAHAARPARFSADDEAQTINWARNQGRWVDVTAVFDSVRWRGIALDPNSNSPQFFGRARGVGQVYPPQLRVSYVK